MKLILGIALAVVMTSAGFASFQIPTKESRKADAAWEKRLRHDFDLKALHDFLVAEIAKHPRFDGVDLSGAARGEQWSVIATERMLLSKSWYFTCDEKGAEFKLHHDPSTGDREIVFRCERRSKREFRLIEVRWEPTRLRVVRFERPNQSLEPTLTIRPFLLMPARLEAPSSLWVSAAHL